MATPRRCQIPPNELKIQRDNKRNASHDKFEETTAGTNNLHRGDRIGDRKAQQVDEHGSLINEVRRQPKQGRNPRETATALAGDITTGGQGSRHCSPADPPPPSWDPPLHLKRRASSHRKAATSDIRYKVCFSKICCMFWGHKMVVHTAILGPRMRVRGGCWGIFRRVAPKHKEVSSLRLCQKKTRTRSPHGICRSMKYSLLWASAEGFSVVLNPRHYRHTGYGQ